VQVRRRKLVPPVAAADAGPMEINAGTVVIIVYQFGSLLQMAGLSENPPITGMW
jgi:hypothetical protein